MNRFQSVYGLFLWATAPNSTNACGLPALYVRVSTDKQTVGAVHRKILAEVGCSHQSLAQFFGVEQVNRNGIAKLLAAMRKRSKPVAPKHLGVIGVEHLKQRFLAVGGNPDTFKYQCRKSMTPDGTPLRRRVCLRAASIRAVARRCRCVPQIRHRRQLERRDQ